MAGYRGSEHCSNDGEKAQDTAFYLFQHQSVSGGWSPVNVRLVTGKMSSRGSAVLLTKRTPAITSRSSKSECQQG